VRAPAGFGDRVEGLHATAAALAAGRLTRLIVESRRANREPVAGLIAQGHHAGVTVDLVDDVRPEAGTEAPQGVVGVGSPIPYRSVDDLVALGSPVALLVLDHIEDPHNLGAAARSALAAGMDGLVIPLRRAAPPGPAALKAAAGALEWLPLAAVTSVADGLERLRRLGVWTLGLDADAERTLFDVELLTEPVAVVVGGEGKGLGRLVAERCDMVASIPLDPRVESLNASVAAALACFEIRRVRSIVR
jgi:23S rRNA (guanosine2251-2'-O)-methyltransferase